MLQEMQRIALEHGDGGRLMRRLLRETILPPLESPHLAVAGDSAILPPLRGRLAFTTDSYVVSPLFFPGGDIGCLAVYGTVNDLAVSGARPRWLSLSFILEEGLPLETLRSVLASIAQAATATGVQVVTGDTKVVPRGAADGMFINTAGIGEMLEPAPEGPTSIQPGDCLIVTGPIGCHGAAVLIAREKLELEPPPESDCGPLHMAVEGLWQRGVTVRAMRDATRGGVAAVLHEWAETASCGFTLDETQMPISPDVRGACELLGLDPLHLANEGTMVLAVPQEASSAALGALQSVPQTACARVVGQARQRGTVPVSVRRSLGREQPLQEALHTPLPRIC
jgi:hydrogenase expression/formation protein HypE